MKRKDSKKLELVFDKLDADHDGRVSIRDLHNKLEGIDSKHLLSFEEKQRLLWKADADGDGFVDREEFVAMLSPKFRPISVGETFTFDTAPNRSHQPSRAKPLPTQESTTSRGTRASTIMSTLSNPKTMMWRTISTIQPPINPARRAMSLETADGTIPFYDEPYYKDYSCCPPPIFLLVISLAQVAVFTGYAVAQGIHPTWNTGCPGCIEPGGHVGVLVFSPWRKQEAWRFLTYMFIHSGIQHILMNMLLQLVLGIPLELVHKPWRIAPIYLGGVIVSSMLQGGFDPNILLVGASGGGYSIITAHLANVVLNWSEFKMPWRVVRLIAIAVLVLLDFGFALYRRYGLNLCDQVSFLGHLGGAISGVLLGLIFLRNLKILEWEKVLKYVCIAIFLALVIGLIVVNILQKPGSRPIFTTRCLETDLLKP